MTRPTAWAIVGVALWLATLAALLAFAHAITPNDDRPTQRLHPRPAGGWHTPVSPTP